MLLLAYSIAIFFVKTWWGMGVFALAFAIAMALSKLPASRVFGIVVPVYVLVALTVLFNSFVFGSPEGSFVAQGIGEGGLLVGCAPTNVVGAIWFVPAGFERGLFFGARILLLVFASLVVSYSTSSTDMMDALNDFLAPLKHVGVPANDVAMVFSIALRFIPVTAEEFFRVRDAQWSRAARFDEGSLAVRLRAWQTVMIPLFVGLFRRADVLASAMDARCYGFAGHARTSLSRRPLAARTVLAIFVGIVACVLVAALL